MEVSKSEAKTYSLLQKTEDCPMCVFKRKKSRFNYLYVYVNSHFLIRSFIFSFFSWELNVKKCRHDILTQNLFL